MRRAVIWLCHPKKEGSSCLRLCFWLSFAAMKKIVFISGSLRRHGCNSQLAQAAIARLSGKAECVVLDYRDLPMLNQDEEFPAPEAVARVRGIVASCDALWISSPEYNHSFSAALKNLIDWLSRPLAPGDWASAVVRGKTVAISSVAGSSGGSFSLSSLSALLEMLSCRIVPTRTMVALGERFGASDLVLSDEESAVLDKECAELLSMISR